MSFLPLVAPADFDFGLGVGVNGILDRSGVLRGSRWLLRGPFSLFSLLVGASRVGVLVEALDREDGIIPSMVLLTSLFIAASASSFGVAPTGMLITDLALRTRCLDGDQWASTTESRASLLR